MKGRKPRPTRLKILAGNPGHRPLNDREPTAGGVPRCPAGLDAEAKREWRRVVAELAQLGILASADRAVIAMYSAAWSTFTQADAVLQQGGMFLRSPEGGAYTNPALFVRNKASEQVVKYAAELGLSPTARTRVKASRPEKTDPLEAFLSGKAN